MWGKSNEKNELGYSITDAGSMLSRAAALNRL
jgi:hypothetical protein